MKLQKKGAWLEHFKLALAEKDLNCEFSFSFSFSLPPFCFFRALQRCCAASSPHDWVKAEVQIIYGLCICRAAIVCVRVYFFLWFLFYDCLPARPAGLREGGESAAAVGRPSKDCEFEWIYKHSYRSFFFDPLPIPPFSPPLSPFPLRALLRSLST